MTIAKGKLGDAFADRIVKAISLNEGGYTSINPDDNGYGISIGIRQWNQKAGELPTLLRGWAGQVSEIARQSLDVDEVDLDVLNRKFLEVFGEYSAKLLDEQWVRTYAMAADSNLMNGIKLALADPDMQAVQRALARDFARKAIRFGERFGFRTELGLALAADLANQKGFGGTERLFAENGLQKDVAIQNEAHTIEQIGMNSKRAGGANRFAQLKGNFELRTPAE